MIPIPSSPGRDERQITDKPQCVVCNRIVNREKCVWIHTREGYYAVTEEETKTLDPAGDSGCYPVGPDCLRRHPELKPYLLLQ